MSNDATSIPSLLRWRPALLTVTAAAAGLGIYYLQFSERTRNGPNDGDDDGSGRELRRSNAIRRRSPRLRHARASITGERSSGAQIGSGVDGETRRDNEEAGNDLDPWGQIAPGGAEGGQSLLNLLYHIAEEQAHREGYVHRGVTCNSCNTMPIKGIRYRCANCPDYDLCEQCENLGVHDKTHLFYKIRIPAPFLGSNPRNQQPVWYPGKPYGLPRTVPKELKAKLVESTGFERSRIDALWEQFKSLAAVDWPQDPSGLTVAIDRKIWAKYCMPTMLREHEAPSGLIFDQSFTFYDDNEDGLVGFEEFLGGLAAKQSKDQQEKLRRIFRAHDLDRDGYVSREDFMKLFTSNYTFMRELSRDLFHIMYEEVLDDRALRDNLRSTQPVSSCFTGTIPPGEASRTGEGKTMSHTGDWVVTDSGGFLREPDDGLVNQDNGRGVMSVLFDDLDQPVEDWPPSFVTPDDARVALDKNVPLNMITGVVEQRQVLDAAHRRIEQQRRGESSMGENPSYFAHRENGALESSSPIANTHSLHIGASDSQRPYNDVEMDLGHVSEVANLALDSSFSQEFLYQATREGFDEVLDPMFKQLEDLKVYRERARKERERLQQEIAAYRRHPENEALCRVWLTRLLRQWRKGGRQGSNLYGDRMAEDILARLVKETQLASSEWATNILDKIYSGHLSEEQLNVEMERLAANHVDTSQSLSRKIRHAWLTAKQGEAPNPEQLDEFLESLDEQMQEKLNGNADANESSSGRAAENVVSVDERFIQDLVDSGEVLDSEVSQEMLDAFNDAEADRVLRDADGDFLGSNSGQIGAAGNAPPGSNPEIHAHSLPNGSIIQGEAPLTFQTLHEVDRENLDPIETHFTTEILNDPVSNMLSDFEFTEHSDEMEFEPSVDPTLPQNRPNLAEEQLIIPSSVLQPENPLSARERSQKFVRWSQVNQEGTIPSMEEEDPFENQESNYFKVKLKYLTILEIAAEDAEERGGTARINEQEFEQFMLGTKGRRLETIGKWLDLAAF